MTVKKYDPAYFHLYLLSWMTACANGWRVGQHGHTGRGQENGEGRLPGTMSPQRGQSAQALIGSKKREDCDMWAGGREAPLEAPPGQADPGSPSLPREMGKL